MLGGNYLGQAYLGQTIGVTSLPPPLGPPTSVGLEYVAGPNRLHYVIENERIHYTAKDE